MILLGARIALAATLGTGRDEAAYWWWAWHRLDASYSLATEALLRFSTGWLGDGAFALRLPGLVAGFTAVGMVMAGTRGLGGGPRATVLAGLALAAAPWHGYVGTVVHPDAFLLPTVLGVAGCLTAVAIDPRRAAWALPLAATAAGLAMLAKLSGGVLILPVAFAVVRHRRASPAGAVAAGAILAAVVAFVATDRDAELIAGLRELGRFHPDLPVGLRFPWVAAEISLLAGGGLLVAAGAGGGPTARRVLPEAARVAAGVGLPLLAFFGLFLLDGQGKGNWYLPGLVPFVPAGVVALERRGRLPALARWTTATAALSLLVGAIWAYPPATDGRAPTARGAAARWLDATYRARAGTRELSVSPTRTWSERLAEYGPAPRLDARIVDALRNGEMAAILSDDYGLAFRSALQVGRSCRVLLPWDPIYSSTTRGAIAAGESVLFLSELRSDVPADWRRRFRTVSGWTARPDPGNLRVFRCDGWLGSEAVAPSEGGEPAGRSAGTSARLRGGREP